MSIRSIPLSITELTGADPLSVTLTLDDRSLPKELELLREQRSVTTWYPGSDEASAQVLGATLEPITLSGRLDDRYMGPGNALLTRSTLDLMVAHGRACSLEWGQFYRRGIIKRAKFAIRLEADIEYELVFEPHGELGLGSTFIVQQAGPDLSTRIQKLGLIAQTIALVPDSVAGVAQSFVFQVNAEAANVTDRVNQLQAIANATADELDAAGDAVTSTQSRVARLVGALSSLRSETQTLRETVQGFSSTNDLIGADAISVFRAESWRYSLIHSARDLDDQARQAADDAQSASDQVIIHVCRNGETLQGISQRYYGTPFRWQDIAAANALDSTTLTGGQVLTIPLSPTNASHRAIPV